MVTIFVVRAHYLISYHFSREMAHIWNQSTQKIGAGRHRIKEQLGQNCEFQVNMDYKMKSRSISKMKHIFIHCVVQEIVFPSYLKYGIYTGSSTLIPNHLGHQKKKCSSPFLVINTFRFCRWVIILCLQSSSVLSQRTIFNIYSTSLSTKKY